MKKRGLVGSLVVVGVLLVVGFFWFVGEGSEDDIECVRVDTGCCSCANGGEEACVLKSEAKNIETEKNCSGDNFCLAVYSCEIGDCEYIEGECVAK
ncbi:hypothetical protein HNV12_03155 [Methanococcoides sp. SA1]|nr:hypothetical protein [Methanococcoides sp. SA1]